MSICGSIVLKDVQVEFFIDENDTCTYTITDLFTGDNETLVCDGPDFMKALAIAVHYDGMPNAEVDYPDAEKIQGEIRWIP